MGLRTHQLPLLVWELQVLHLSMHLQVTVLYGEMGMS